MAQTGPPLGPRAPHQRLGGPWPLSPVLWAQPQGEVIICRQQEGQSAKSELHCAHV